MRAFSLNNRLIIEAYKKEALKAEVKNGFAMIGQKVSLKGLRVLADCHVTNGPFIPAGSIAYIKEEYLHTAQWAKTPLQCEDIPVQFLVVELAHVEFFVPPSESVKSYGTKEAAIV